MQIAVVGIACRYPGANSARDFIENILAGRRYFQPNDRDQLPRLSGRRDDRSALP